MECLDRGAIHDLGFLCTITKAKDDLTAPQSQKWMDGCTCSYYSSLFLYPSTEMAFEHARSTPQMSSSVAAVVVARARCDKEGREEGRSGGKKEEVNLIVGRHAKKRAARPSKSGMEGDWKIMTCATIRERESLRGQDDAAPACLTVQLPTAIWKADRMSLIYIKYEWRGTKQGQNNPMTF